MTAAASTNAPSVAPRRGDFPDMNDWLNAMVGHRIARQRAVGETMTAETVFVADTGHDVYQRRFKPMVLAVLLTIGAGFVLAPSLPALLFTFVALYFWVDFYSGVLHVVLDDPTFCRLPLIGVPCVEFQWHHNFEYDIATRSLFDVWGDLNVLLFVKALLLFGIAVPLGHGPTALMVAGVGFFWAYANQVAHRMAHTSPKKRPEWVKRLQGLGVLVPPRTHQDHHATHDTSFPVLSGRSRGLIDGLRERVPNRWVWLGVFLFLTGFDLVLYVFAFDAVAS